jgi:hypothetical protein
LKAWDASGIEVDRLNIENMNLTDEEECMNNKLVHRKR